MAEFDHFIAESWSWRDVDFLGFVAFLCVLALQFLKCFETRLRFGLATFALAPNQSIFIVFCRALLISLTSALQLVKLNSSFKRMPRPIKL